MGAQMSIYTFLKSKKAFFGKNSSKLKGAIIEILPPRDEGKNKSGITKSYQN